MSQSLAKYFVSNDFNPERFVKDLSTQCIGADELRQQRVKIQELASNTSASLKRNVYQNYTQFIETAKEISHLESEMYQLSQLLSEQRSLLNIISINNNTGIILENDSEIQIKSFSNSQIKEDAKLKLVQLLENVDGASNLIETPGRTSLYDGCLLELDPLDGTPLRRIHAYLFNDVLMIASWYDTCNRRGSPRYKVQVIYDLQSLAVVNIKDLGTVKFAFKLLVFPDTRVFQCSTATSKREWLEKCDQAKKLKSTYEKQSKISDIDASNGKEHFILNNHLQNQKSSNLAELTEILPEWLIEIIEDLDSCIAQRHFEDSYNLLQKANKFFNITQNSQDLTSLKFNLLDRTNHLVNILTKELELCAESKSLQGGGYRSAKRPVKLLIQLDRNTQACQLYLILCSATLKARLKKVKREGATTCYVKELSSIAFRNIAEMSEDFLSLFPHSTKCISAFIVWCSHELKILMSHLSKQMFLPQVSLNALTECLITIRTHCEQLINVGIDFLHQHDIQLRNTLVKTLQEINEKYIDAIKIRATEDNWKPSYLKSNKNFHKLCSELESLGIPMPQFVDNEYTIPLTGNTLNFSKLYIGLVEDCLNLYLPEIVTILEKILIGVLQIQIQHLQLSLANSKTKNEIILIRSNIQYIDDIVVNRTLELYKSVVGQPFTKLQISRKQIKSEPKYSYTKPQPAPRNSVTKYSSTEYI